MNDLIKSVSCPDCKQSLAAHVNDIVVKWVLLDVSYTISRMGSIYLSRSLKLGVVDVNSAPYERESRRKLSTAISSGAMLPCSRVIIASCPRLYANLSFQKHKSLA